MIHDFAERLAFSEGVELHEGLVRRLLDGIPGSIALTRATKAEDRSGTDYWVIRRGLPPISVDVKHREFDPIERFGRDDACIETTSIYTGPAQPPWQDGCRKKLGWTLDATKRTDLVVYTWPQPDGARRFWILYFPHLCRAAQLCWRDWAEKYGEKAAANDGYLTLSVFPERREVARAMRELTVGVA